jgi:hypothetical protein
MREASRSADILSARAQARSFTQLTLTKQLSGLAPLADRMSALRYCITQSEKKRMRGIAAPHPCLNEVIGL